MERKGKILITNIQRFSLHDGPGIRTTVFLKGCSLRCPWCSNPENLDCNIQPYIENGVEKFYGRYYTCEELYQEIMKDRKYYRGNIKEYCIRNEENIADLPGGITFSGGESLLQIEALVPLCEKLKEEHIHMTSETCLFVPQSSLELAICYMDFFYADLKILNVKQCQEIIGGSLELYLSNLNLLLHSGKPVVIRIPVIGGFTDTRDNMERAIQLICEYASDEKVNLLKIELIKEHNLGISKYQSLAMCNAGYKTPEYKGVSDEVIELYKEKIAEKIKEKIPVDVCKI